MLAAEALEGSIIASPIHHSEATAARWTFPRWANYLLPAAILLGGGAATYVPTLVYLFAVPSTTDVGYAPQQPVAFSHALHAGELGMDCTYCHNTVEQAAFAAVPPTQTCINCHAPEGSGGAAVHAASPLLAKVRESYATGMPVEWETVHDLPDHAYFNHAAHVNKGVGCVECHGRIDKMEVVYQHEPLSMGWCLECHRDPGPRLRPREEVTNLAWDPQKPETWRKGTYEVQASAGGGGGGGGDVAYTMTQPMTREELGAKLVEAYNVHDQSYMTACSTCHR